MTRAARGATPHGCPCDAGDIRFNQVRSLSEKLAQN
jgi:hypothetical protein